MQHLERGLLQARSMERVFAAIPRDAHLRQTEDARPRRAGRLNRSRDAPAIAVPVQGRGVDDGGTNAQEFHSAGRACCKLILSTRQMTRSVDSDQKLEILE